MIPDTFTFKWLRYIYVFKVTPPKQQWYFYTYWSSPVENQTIGNAFPNTDADRRFYLMLTIYLDQHTVGTTNGIPDGIDDNGDVGNML